MYFLYVDESGDTGDKPSSSNYFILSGVLIHHSHWRESYVQVKALRERLWRDFGIPSYAELHASEFLGKNVSYYRLTRSQRIKCALHVVGFLRMRPRIMLVRSIISKPTSSECCYELAWRELMRLAEQRINDVGIQGACDTKGMLVVCDDHRTSPRKEFTHRLNALVELNNPIVEKPFGMDSRDCDFLQLADLLAYLSKQMMEPSSVFHSGHSRVIIRRNEELFERNL